VHHRSAREAAILELDAHAVGRVDAEALEVPVELLQIARGDRERQLDARALVESLDVDAQVVALVEAQQALDRGDRVVGGLAHVEADAVEPLAAPGIEPLAVRDAKALDAPDRVVLDRRDAGERGDERDEAGDREAAAPAERAG
jgi:hypothetical protein